MIELLQLCGFETEEIESELPRIKRAFDKLGIASGDIERSKQRLHKYYAVEMKGVRKLLRLFIKDLTALMLAREEGKKKIIYAFMAPTFAILGSALAAKSEDIYTAHLAQVLQLILGSVFGKIVPVLEAAEERWLKAGKVAHCGNVKTLAGLFALDLVPKPDLLITSDSLCEASPKTIELLHELYDIPIYNLGICQDRDLPEYSEATKRAIELAGKSMKNLCNRVEEVVGFEVTEGMLQEAINIREEIGPVMRKINRLIDESDPPPLRNSHRSFWPCLAFLPLTRKLLPELLNALNTLCEELQEKVDKGIGIIEKEAPRIVAILPSHYTDPELDYMVEGMGMNIVATDHSFSYPDVGELEDIYERMAASDVTGSLHGSLSRRVALIVEGCKKLKVDGVINRFHIGCRTVTGDALMIKDAITKELGIPVLMVERDDFDPRVCDHERYRRNLELFKTILVK
ncbi:MAG: 2-hydroxyacyl-CoA dehydratase [Dehalococcoidales bacterium]|nr:2-hydroxyacyl-CoA dehydratase [Dehalococcoidales bacterium]